MTNLNITLDRLELYLLDLPQKRSFKSGIGVRKSKETLLVKWIDKDGRIGYGECSCRPDPYYSAEFLAAAIMMIQQFIVPQLQKEQTYGELLRVLQRVRGWNFAKAAVEAAAFQVLNQEQNGSLLDDQLLATPLYKVPVGISLGIYDDKAAFHDRVQEALEIGYQRLKFKISPLVDTQVFDHINPLLEQAGLKVSFDANGSYHANDLEKMRYFVDTYPTIIEQPTPPDRFDLLLRAKELLPDLEVCFDEEVKNMGDVVKLHRLGVLDELNLKPGRVGGITTSIQIMNYCHEHAIPCWIGGMFETGIGRLQNLALAAYLPANMAHDLSPSSRYFKEDIVTPEVVMEQGFITVETANKCVVAEDRIEKYTTDKSTFTLRKK